MIKTITFLKSSFLAIIGVYCWASYSQAIWPSNSSNSGLQNSINAISSSNDLSFADLIRKSDPSTPEMQIYSNAIVILDGDASPFMLDNTDYGSSELGTTMSREFTIKNSGTGPLTISSIILSNAVDFTIVNTSYPSTIPISGYTTIRIRYNALSEGIKNTTVSIWTSNTERNPFDFVIKAETKTSFFDSDGDGIFDHDDIDDDNDGIEDAIEELACKNSNISIQTTYKILNEDFGTGNRAKINTTYNALTSYCYEDGTASCSGLGGMDLNDGEYTVNHSATNDNGNNNVQNETVELRSDEFWYTGEDHSFGDTNGRMALFNASSDSEIFYTARINGSLPNVPVTYSFWALNLDTVHTPNLNSRLKPNIRVEFRDVNDIILGSFTTGEIPPSINGDADASWHNFSADVTFPVSEFNIFFYNNQSGGLGNDLAIDDINISQTLCDTDGDGVANLFDLDSDNDGIPDVVESGFGAVSNGKAKIDIWQDDNTNGMHDAFEGLTLLDSDSDGIPNFIDLDSDNDSIFDIDESGAGNSGNPNYDNGDGDIDGDGTGDGADTDAVRKKDTNSDGIPELFSDGILDVFDFYNGSIFTSAYGNSNQGVDHTNYVRDLDGDNIPDYIDTYNNTTGIYDISQTLYAYLDDNEDGVIDGSIDADGDGLLDVFDTDDSVFGSPRDLDQKLQLYFDGRNDYVQDASLTSGWSEISLMGWVKMDPSGEGTRVIFGQNNFYLGLVSDGRLYLSTDGTPATYNRVLPTNQWIHIGATYSDKAGKLKLFVNGEPVIEVDKTGALETDSSLFTIGRKATASRQFFKGYVDEVRLFDKALSEDEFQKIIYQEIENNGHVKGTEIPHNISTLSWSHLKRYYKFDRFKHAITDDHSSLSTDIGVGAKLYNIKTITPQSAPMPFKTQRGHVSLPEALTIASDGIKGEDATTYDWSIVRIEHSDISFPDNQKYLGLFINEEDVNSNPIEYYVTNNSELNVSWYLELNGFIDLEGESQLIQGSGSILEVGINGKVERDQQGTADMYTYNYWSSPVNTALEGSNSTDYRLNDVLKDGTDTAVPKKINWIRSGYDGAATDPIGLADYWIWKFNNYLTEDYSLWQHVRSNGTLKAGEGFTMKGPGTGAFFEEQNYVFVGKPNNGDLSLELKAGSNYLLGNPYPSAIDADQFIIDNGRDTNADQDITNTDSPGNSNPTSTGALYFWNHWGGGSHILSDYQGGYGIYNFSGAVAAPSFGTDEQEVATEGTLKKRPGRYIPVGQGFFVVAKHTGPLKFNNAQRIFEREADFNSVFMRSDETEPSDLRMKIRIGFNSVNTIHRQLLLTIDSLATPSVDYGFDAMVLDDLIDDLYWIIEGDNYTIQGRDAVDESTKLPLGMHVASSGINEIKLDGLENVTDDLKIYLHDIDTDVYHNLNTSSYQFTSDTGTYLNRFEITFAIPNTLTIEEENFNTLKFYYAFTRNKIVILNPNDIELEHLEIFNIMGQSVDAVSDLYQDSYNEYEVNNLSSGAYIVQLRTPSGTLTKKIIIK